jgi:hypothetical protein
MRSKGCDLAASSAARIISTSLRLAAARHTVVYVKAFAWIPSLRIVSTLEWTNGMSENENMFTLRVTQRMLDPKDAGPKEYETLHATNVYWTMLIIYVTCDR